MDELTIRTSAGGWLQALARAYRARQPVVLIDDAQVGVNPADESLLAMGLRARLRPQDWTAVAVSLGMGMFGAWMVVAAVLDPEPTSKLGLMVGGGAVLCLTGGGGAIRVLTKMRPPSVRMSSRGFEITWPS